VAAGAAGAQPTSIEIKTTMPITENNILLVFIIFSF
jgi:hypothetical protein